MKATNQLWRRAERGFAVGGALFALLGCSSSDGTSGSDASVLEPPSQSADGGFPLADAAKPSDARAPMLCRGGVASQKQPLIDDFEDGDGLIVVADDRNGRWVVKNDGSGEQVPGTEMELLPETVPLPDAALLDGGSSLALHSEGSGFDDWGAAVSFDFHTQGDLPCLYDVSYYQGIGFRAKGTGTLRLEVSVPATVPVQEGGTCAGEGCGNRHGFRVELGSEWKRYAIGFLQLAQESGSGQPASFDPTSVLGVFFRAAPSQTFELWIDDVRFFPDPSLPDAGDGGSGDAELGVTAPSDASTDI